MILQVKNVVKRYKQVIAVDQVSLEIQEGQIFGLLGPNGAGKTTLIHSIVGLVPVESGTITVFGLDHRRDERQVKQQIGVVPQELAIFEDLTAMENVGFFGSLYGLKGKHLKQEAAKALEFVGLGNRSQQYPKTFSGGMKRRLNIACGIVHRPRLVIMDEPTVGIDPQSRNHILDSVRDLNREGMTVLYTSHYMEEVEQLCHDIAIMDNGRIIAKGTKEELKDLVARDEIIHLQLAALNGNTESALRSIGGVKECRIDGRDVSVISEKNSGNLSRVMQTLHQEGLEIQTMSVERPTLESVFLTLTGRNLRDE